MVQGYISEIRPFAYDAIPEHWMPCNGQELQIRDNPALFSLVGFMYGGNGSTTFCLPDLRARIPIHRSERRDFGARVKAASASDAVPTEPQPFLALNFCICVAGVFPSRP
jgi:microcystin-dependent protein